MNTHDARPTELAPDASLQDGAEGSVVRGGPEWRQLSFRASGLTIELEITGGGEYRRLMGQLIPEDRRRLAGAAEDVPRGGGAEEGVVDPRATVDRRSPDAPP